MKTLQFKINYFLILIFFIIPFSVSAEDLFLINPSSQCKKYQSESLSNILNIDKGVYKLSIIDDGFKVKKPVVRESIDDEAVEISETSELPDPDDLAEGGRPGKGVDYLMGL